MAKKTPNVSDSVSLLCSHVDALLSAKTIANSRGRVLIALAGVPGSGKSTISSALLQALPGQGIDHIAVLPMVSCLAP